MPVSRCAVSITTVISEADWINAVNAIPEEGCRQVKVLLQNPDREYLLIHPQSAIRCRNEINRRVVEGSVFAGVAVMQGCTPAEAAISVCAVVKAGIEVGIWEFDAANPCTCAESRDEAAADVPVAATTPAEPLQYRAVAELQAIPHIGRKTAEFLCGQGISRRTQVTQARVRALLNNVNMTAGVRGALTRFVNAQHD